jgi:hypothetical protein
VFTLLNIFGRFIYRKYEIMKIVIKQIDELRGTTKPNGKVVEEYLVYLMDHTGRPLTCEIAYGKAAKNDEVNRLLIEHFLPLDWETNKISFDVSNIIEEVSYDEYVKQIA